MSEQVSPRLHWSSFPAQPHQSSIDVDPLIQEARDRQRRRRRWIAAALLLAAGGVLFSVTHWTGTGQAGTACSTSGSCGSSRSVLGSALPNPCALLSGAQAAVGLGSTAAGKSVTGDGLGRTCTWSSEPMGFEQMQNKFTLDLSRATKAQFINGHRRLGRRYPQFRPLPVDGLGSVAYRSSNGYGLDVWQNGVVVSLDSEYLAAFPAKANALARIILKQLRTR